MGNIARIAEEILDALLEHGTMPSEEEVAALCDAAVEGDAISAKYSALEHTLAGAGWTIIDLTTDDHDEAVIGLVPPESDE